MLDLSSELRTIRKKLGKTQQEIADEYGIPQTTWANYEVGKASPPMRILISLAEKGYPIKGLTTSILEDMVEDGKISKAELQKRLEIARALAEKAPPDTLIDDEWAKLVNAEYEKQNILENSYAGLIAELEKVIKKSQTINNLTSRIEAVESSLKKLHSLKSTSASETYGKDDVYTVESDLEYGETIYSNLFVAESEPTPEYMTRSIAFCDDVAAGPPIWQSEDKGRVVDVPYHLIKTSENDYYALRVKGNSMIDAFIPDGSMVLIKKSDVPQHGKIQVIWLDDRVTLKRMREGEDHSWSLCYEDGTGRTIPLGERNQIQGTFEAVLPPATRPRMRRE